LAPAALALLVVAAACGQAETDPPMPRPPVGEPISAPTNTWTWVDFPDAVCDDNSSTGLGVNLNGSKNLLIFMTGGGACWDYATCYVLNTSTHGPFKQADFEKMAPEVKGSILDRTLPDNPFADYNLVFIPYCTGDVHSGDNVAMYKNAGKTYPTYHKGRSNLVAFLKRIAPTLPDPEKLVVSGASAGGFGSAVNYDLFRQYFPQTQGESYLLDDSGPAFPGNDIPSFERSAWYSAWNLGQALGTLCPDCENDFSSLVPIVSKKYPKDRMALLSHTQDSVIRTFFLLSPMDFQTDLYSLADTVIDPLPNMHYFIQTGTTHTFLGQPAGQTSQGVDLLTWLGEMAHDSPNWASVKP
jgi:hypothetical protein